MKPTETIEQLALMADAAIEQCGGRVSEFAAIGPVHRAALHQLCQTFLSELERQQEPVAWMYESKQGHRMISEERRIIHAYDSETPLCKGPAIPQPAAVPNGWKLVPKVLTQEMDSNIQFARGHTKANQFLWDEALSAAPVPPSQEANDAVKTYSLQIVQANGSVCVYLDDYRIAGGKPWGGGKTLHTLKCRAKDIHEAIAISASKEASDV